MAQKAPPYLQQLLNSKLNNSCTLQSDLYNRIILIQEDKSAFHSYTFGIRKLQEIIDIYFALGDFSNPKKLTEKQLNFALKKFQSQIIENIRILFHNCDVALITELSAEPYESNDVSNMALTILNEEQIRHIDEVSIIYPNVKFEAESVRHIRKLINITKSEPTESVNYCLVMKYKDGEISTYGYADRKNIAKKFPVINFVGHMNWTIDLPPMLYANQTSSDSLFEEWYDLPCQNRCVARYKKGRILLPVVGNDSKEIEAVIQNKMASYFSADQILMISNRIIKVCNEAKKQKKGTSIIFLPSELAEGEKQRLFDFSRAYVPSENLFDDMEKTLLRFSNIDGTNFIDYEKNTYVAFGVLLDGKANIKCDLSKGSRHSSVLTYLNQCRFKKPTLAFVLSEDGGYKFFIKCYGKSAERVL